MAIILTAKRETNVATLTLDDATGLVVGETVIVYNLGGSFDGLHTLLSVDLATDTITYHSGGQDVAVFNVPNGLLFAQVTWASVEDVENYLGYVPVAASADEAYLEDCVAAANCWAYRRRRSAGYRDNPTAPPCSSSKLGVILMAGAMFRQKGSVDGFQSYNEMSFTAPTGNLGEVMKLLGINRAQVG
jgi:hypothetical protein